MLKEEMKKIIKSHLFRRHIDIETPYEKNVLETKTEFLYELFIEENPRAVEREDVNNYFAGLFFKHIKKDYPRMLYFYNRAVKNEKKPVIEAIKSLGAFFYSIGDVRKAEDLYKLGIKNGSVDSMAALAVLYDDRGDDERALIWRKKASRLGNLISTYELAMQYQKSGDYDEMKKYTDIGIKRNDVEFYLFLYHHYKEFEANEELMFKNINKAIELGSPHAVYMLGKYHGKRGDYEKMEEYYKRAVKKGSIRAMFEISRFYLASKKKGEFKKHMMMTLKEDPKYAERYKEFYKSRPNDIKLLSFLGNEKNDINHRMALGYYYLCADLDLAIDYYKKYFKRYPQTQHTKNYKSMLKIKVQRNVLSIAKSTPSFGNVVGFTFNR